MPPLTFGEMVTLAHLYRFGAHDTALPDSWLSQDREKRREYCWLYRKSRGICGRALSYRAVARLAIRDQRRNGVIEITIFLQLWAYAYPNRPLDSTGLAAVRTFLESEPDCTDALTAFLSELAIPAPSAGYFAESLAHTEDLVLPA